MSRTILAIGGHIGDMDLTAGPVLAAAALAGDRVVMLACTYGERGHPRLTPAQYRVHKIREGEQFAAGIGAEFHTLDYSDGFLPDDDGAAGQIAELIRAVRPEVIITHWVRSIHRDHERAALLAERARFLAGLPLDDGPSDGAAVTSRLPRHSVARILHADNWEDAAGFDPDLYVPVSDEAFARWSAAIGHESFARGETYGFRYIDYYTALMSAKGCLAGTSRACCFMVGGERQAVPGDV